MSRIVVEPSLRANSFVAPSATYRILASSSALHKNLTDAYWCDAMEEVCEGKLDGVAVRYTGHNLVMVQFRPKKLSPAGYRYPLSLSIPAEYLVPVSAINGSLESSCKSNSFRAGLDRSPACSSARSSEDSLDRTSSTCSGVLMRLCVVCGRYNVPDMILRRHGYKCKECVGKKSLARLRLVSKRLRLQEDM